MFLGSGAGAGGYTHHRAGPGRRAAAGVHEGPPRDLRRGRRHQPVQGEEDRDAPQARGGRSSTSRGRRTGSTALDTQLRTLRMQAAKAQKYKEYSDRLRELRVGLGAARVPRTHRGARSRTAQFSPSCRPRSPARTGRPANWRRRSANSTGRCRERGWAAAPGGPTGRRPASRSPGSRRRSSTSAPPRRNYEAELLRIGRQRAELGYRTKAIEADAARAAADAAAAEERLAGRATRGGRGRERACGGSRPRGRARPRVAADRDRQFELVGEAAAARVHRDRPVSRRSSGFRRSTRASSRRSSNRPRAAPRWPRPSTDCRGPTPTCRPGSPTARDRLGQLQTDRDELADRHRARAGSRSKRSASGRATSAAGSSVLEDLERTLDGLGAGVRHVLELMKLGANCASRRFGDSRRPNRNRSR